MVTITGYVTGIRRREGYELLGIRQEIVDDTGSEDPKTIPSETLLGQHDKTSVWCNMRHVTRIHIVANIADLQKQKQPDFSLD